VNQPDQFSRRAFLRGRVLPALQATIENAQVTLATAASEPCQQPSRQPSARYERSFPVMRPPGAVAEDEFLAGCTRCEACIKACPHQAIVHAPERFRRAAGTPLIDPVNQPCWMCADYPCIASCEPQVLRSALPKTMATARIEQFNCLAWQGSFCTVCSEQCPVTDAIALETGKPRIVENVCTGCGVCQHVCPAPQNAILLMPLSNRPSAPQAPTA
jgi:ferredoxin-type protein NapG